MTTTGLKGIVLDTKELDKLTDELKPKAKRIVKEAAFGISLGAKIGAPVDTHALQNSIRVDEIGPFTWRVSDGVDYGIHQELGTSRMAAQPFMVPAVEKERRNYFNKAWKELFK